MEGVSAARETATGRRRLQSMAIGKGMDVRLACAGRDQQAVRLPDVGRDAGETEGTDGPAAYAVEDIDSGVVASATGQALLETGLAVAIGDKPGTSVQVHRKAAQR